MIMVNGILVKICFWVGVVTIMDKVVCPALNKIRKRINEKNHENNEQ